MMNWRNASHMFFNVLVKCNFYIFLSLPIYLFISHTICFSHSLLLLNSGLHLLQASLAPVRMGGEEKGVGFRCGWIMHFLWCLFIYSLFWWLNSFMSFSFITLKIWIKCLQFCTGTHFVGIFKHLPLNSWKYILPYCFLSCFKIAIK